LFRLAHALKDVANRNEHAEARFDRIQRFHAGESILPVGRGFTYPPVVAMHTHAPRRARTTEVSFTVR